MGWFSLGPQDNIVNTGVSTGQILKWNGSEWAPENSESLEFVYDDYVFVSKNYSGSVSTGSINYPYKLYKLQSIIMDSLQTLQNISNVYVYVY